jgi:hypothetical protein
MHRASCYSDWNTLHSCTWYVSSWSHTKSTRTAADVYENRHRQISCTTQHLQPEHSEYDPRHAIDWSFHVALLARHLSSERLSQGVRHRSIVTNIQHD